MTGPKKYIAANMHAALRQIKADLGDDAIIINSQNLNNQVHVEAMPYSEEAMKTPVRASSRDQFDDIILSKQANIAVPKVDESIKQELVEIKKMLTMQPFHEKSLHPIMRQVRERLSSFNFSNNLIQYLISDVNTADSVESTWEAVVKNMMRDMVVDNTLLSPKPVKAIIGPSGAGKTHYISKLIQYQKLIELGTSFAFIFVNHSNLKTLEEARAFSRIFSTPALHVESLSELESAYLTLADFEHIFVEFPGYDFNNHKNNECFRFLHEQAEEVDSTLIVNAMAPCHYIEHYMKQLGPIDLNGFSLTKMDEMKFLEGATQFNLKYKIPLRYCSTGSEMFTHLESASKPVFHHYFINAKAGASVACQTN